MDPVKVIRGKAVAIPIANIDTDQITPARFLKITSKGGAELARVLFHDWRFTPDETLKPEFSLNDPRAQGASVLVAGDNFGCGSSREHATWALLAYGFRAIISTSFADIFRNNALKNGLLTCVVSPADHEELMNLLAHEPGRLLTVDLEEQTIDWGAGRKARFPIDPFSKRCLLRGVDEMGYLLDLEPQIAEYERTHPRRLKTC